MSYHGIAMLMPKVPMSKHVIVMETYLDSDTYIDVRIKNTKTMDSIRKFKS